MRQGESPYTYRFALIFLGVILFSLGTVACFESENGGVEFGEFNGDTSNSAGPQTGFDPGEEPIRNTKILCELPTKSGLYVPPYYKHHYESQDLKLFVRDNKLFTVHAEKWGSAKTDSRVLLTVQEIYSRCPVNYITELDDFGAIEPKAIFYDELRSKLYILDAYDLIVVDLMREVTDPDRVVVYGNFVYDQFGGYVYVGPSFFDGTYGYLFSAATNVLWTNTIHRFTPPDKYTTPSITLLSVKLPVKEFYHIQTDGTVWDSDKKRLYLFGMEDYSTSGTDIYHPVYFEPKTLQVGILSQFDVSPSKMGQLAAIYHPASKKTFVFGMGSTYDSAIYTFDETNGFVATPYATAQILMRPRLALDMVNNLILAMSGDWSSQEFSTQDNIFLLKP